MRDSVSLASGGVEARGKYLRPCDLASARAAPSSLYFFSLASALAAYSLRSQVLRKEVSFAEALGGADMVRWAYRWGVVRVEGRGLYISAIHIVRRSDGEPLLCS